MDAARNLTHASKAPTTTVNQSISQAPVYSLVIQIKTECKRLIRAERLRSDFSQEDQKP